MVKNLNFEQSTVSGEVVSTYSSEPNEPGSNLLEEGLKNPKRPGLAHCLAVVLNNFYDVRFLMLFYVDISRQSFTRPATTVS